jgi:cytochrome P450/NADPH-cytochrome P450 reductase
MCTGHKDWRATLYKVPIAIDQLLQRSGARRLAPLFKVDTATEDAFVQLERWEEQHLWAALTIKPDTAPGGTTLRVFLQDPPSNRNGYSRCLVRGVSLLTASTISKKIHIDIDLPKGTEYSIGDALSIIPLNPKITVQRALSRFHLAWDTYLKLESDSAQDLPTEYPISVADLLGAFVELNQTATPSVCIATP